MRSQSDVTALRKTVAGIEEAEVSKLDAVTSDLRQKPIRMTLRRRQQISVLGTLPHVAFDRFSGRRCILNASTIVTTALPSAHKKTLRLGAHSRTLTKDTLWHDYPSWLAAGEQSSNHLLDRRKARLRQVYIDAIPCRLRNYGDHVADTL